MALTTVVVVCMYTCERCERMYTTRSGLRKHTCGLFPCQKCRFTTDHEREFKVHTEKHTREFNCDKCSYSCRARRMLRTHKQKHSENKTYKCKKCDFATRWKQYLRKHVNIHN